MEVTPVQRDDEPGSSHTILEKGGPARQPVLPLAISNGLEVTVVAPPTIDRYAPIHGGLGSLTGGFEPGYALVTRFNP
jgi:hypothetical protein